MATSPHPPSTPSRCALIVPCSCTSLLHDAASECCAKNGREGRCSRQGRAWCISSTCCASALVPSHAPSQLPHPVLPALVSLPQDEMVGSGLLQLIQGRFRDEGSLQRALELVSLGGGIDK